MARFRTERVGNVSLLGVKWKCTFIGGELIFPVKLDASMEKQERQTILIIETGAMNT